VLGILLEFVVDVASNIVPIHRPNGNPRMFFSHLEVLVFVLKENYASYRVKPEQPAQQTHGGYSADNMSKYANDSIDCFANFLFTQMFKATAPENVRRLLSHKDQTRLTIRCMCKVFFTHKLLEMDKKASPIHAAMEDQDLPNMEQQDVAAFCPQQRQQYRGSQQNFNNRGNNCS
jgi:hypothetical protein